MKLPTRLIHHRSGRTAAHTVNPPIQKASTVLFKTRQALYGEQPGYGRMGLGAHRELSDALCLLESATQARLAPSGLAACSLALASVLKAGDHLLYADTVYGPTRRFCERRLPAMGVRTTPFSPRIGAKIEDLIEDDTKAIFLESPGSLTFELTDTTAFVEVAKRHDLITLIDNTWAAGVFHKPLELGVDVSIQALTKYIVGHADAFGGAVMTRDDRLSTLVAETAEDWGISLGPDEAYTCLRGLRTLNLRLDRHQTNAMTLASWLDGHDMVSEVLYPALPDHPDHAIWQRDFTGASGLFGFVMQPVSEAQIDAFLESLTLFGMGFSWGGYESLIIPFNEQLKRMEGDWTERQKGPLFRVHAGLEDADDLIADLSQAFDVMLTKKTLD